MPVSNLGSAPRIAGTSAQGSTAQATPADLKTAGKVKAAVLDILPRLQLGKPVAFKQSTTLNGVVAAPNGNRLFAVSLPSTASTASSGWAPGPKGSTAALVDPKTNTFFISKTGTNAPDAKYGPFPLPAGLRFEGTGSSNARFEALDRAGQAKPKVPSEKNILASMNAQQANGSLKWSKMGRPQLQALSANIVARSAVREGVDAMILKDNKVILVRADPTSVNPLDKQYSQPFDVK